MPAPLPEPVETLLWCAAGLMLAYVLIPYLFMMAGQTRCTFAVLGGPETASPGDDPRHADLYDSLRELGFEPLGSRREIAWLANGHWYKRYLPGRVWATPGRDCFALLFRLFPEEPWRLTFFTVFTDGAAVKTARQLTRLRIEEPDFLRLSCPSPDLSEVLGQHHDAVEYFRVANGRTVAAPDLPEALSSVCRHSERHIRKNGLTTALNNVRVPLYFLGLAVCGVGACFGFGNWTTAAAVLLGGAAFKLAMPALRRGAAQRLRDEDRRRELARRWKRRAADADERVGPGPAGRA